MAKVTDMWLDKRSAMYPRNGRYTYGFITGNDYSQVFTAWVTKSPCSPCWELAISNRYLEQVYQFPFETKRDCLTFIKRDFDSAEYTREAFVESERHRSW